MPVTKSGTEARCSLGRVPKASLPLKRSFPFRLATTSYIFPADILPNIRCLGRYFDEMELVLFESGQENNLPTPGEVREMARLASDLDLTYNVHLPADLFFGDPDPALRRKFCETAFSFYERTLPLAPTSYILHLDSRKADETVEPDGSAWRDRVCESLQTMQMKGDRTAAGGCGKPRVSSAAHFCLCGSL